MTEPVADDATTTAGQEAPQPPFALVEPGRVTVNVTTNDGREFTDVDMLGWDATGEPLVIGNEGRLIRLATWIRDDLKLRIEDTDIELALPAETRIFGW